jgi:hypothetical protein
MIIKKILMTKIKLKSKIINKKIYYLIILWIKIKINKVNKKNWWKSIEKIKLNLINLKGSIDLKF